MSQNLRHLLDQAESAAAAGDFASADELLRNAARIQEEELGPLHPDLANTLNNLAVVAEKTGRSGEAESALSPGARPSRRRRFRPTIRWSWPAGRTSKISAARAACRWIALATSHAGAPAERKAA